MGEAEGATYLGVPFGKCDQNALLINPADKKSPHLLGLPGTRSNY